MSRRIAPWKDFSGKKIREGDTILHPDNTRGVVVFLPHETLPEDQWRVDYGDGALSRLCLQIDDMGMAIVV
jgi:hypothetical protein